MGCVFLNGFAMVNSLFRKQHEDRKLYEECCKKIDELIQKYAKHMTCLRDWDYIDLEEYGRCHEVIYHYEKNYNT